MNIRDSPEDYESDSLSEDASERENDDIQQDQSHHVGVTFMADKGKAFFGKCYNCGEWGHPWWECKKPLRPALKLALIAENERKAALAEKKGLNQTRGTGVKGGHVPKVTPAAAQKKEPARILPAATGTRTHGTGGWDQKIFAKSWWMVNRSLPSLITVPR